MDAPRSHDDRYRYAEGEILPAFTAVTQHGEAELVIPAGEPVSRRFALHRTVDASGISGTGHVADGVRFPDGVCALHWVGGLVGVASTAVYGSVGDLVAIHGHSGNTRVVWAD